MADHNECPKCGTQLAANALAGVCPKCLLMAGLGESASEGQNCHEEATIVTSSSDAGENQKSLATLPRGTSIVGIGTKVRYFGEYELLTEIARGGMGVVYKARQVRLNRIVALKMILSGQFAGAADVQRFHTEAEAAARLDHPGIVPIFEVGEHEGHHFFTMGFVEGGALAARLQNGPLPPRDAALLVRQIADAVQYAHERGVIHRDLKPANILLDGDGQPRITDFGLAKNVQHDTGQTATGQVLGTPGYMPPEQAMGNIGQVREPADVYSLGAVLYALLTGRPPFQADNALDTLMQVIEREPVAPSALNSRVSKDLETICLKCLQKDRQRRYASAAALVDDLGRFLRGEPILARPVGIVSRGWRWCRRNPVIASLIMLVCVSLIAGTSVSTYYALEADKRATGETQQRLEADRQTIKAKEQLTRSEWLLYANQIASARREWELHNSALALDHLNRTRPDFRGWEFEYLSRQLGQSLRKRFQAHSDAVLAIALSRDDRLVASAGRDKAVKLWNVGTGQLLHSLNTDQQYVTKLAFSADHQRVAGISSDGKLRIWAVASGQIEKVITTHAVSALSASTLQFLPDGLTIATGNRDGTIHLWDVKSGTERRSFALPNSLPALAIAVSPDGQRLGFGLPAIQGRSDLYVYDLATGEQRLHVPGLEGAITDVAFHDKGTQLASSTVASTNVAQGSIQLRDVATGRETLLIPFRARSIAWSDDGQRILGVSMDGLLKSWDSRTAAEITSFKGQTTYETPIAISRASGILINGGAAGSISIWESAVEDRAREIPQNEWVHTVAFSQDGTQVVTGTGQKVVLWNATSGHRIREFSGHTGYVSTVAFHPSGDKILSASWDCSIRLWDVSMGLEAWRTGGCMRESDAISFSPDGKWVGTAFGAAIQWIDVATGKVARTIQRNGATVTAITFGPDSQTIISGDAHGAIEYWDGELRRWSAQAEGGAIRNVTSSTDGRWVAAVTKSLRLTVWNAVTGEQQFTTTDPGGIYCVRFSPDSKRLVAGCADMNIRFWSVESGQQIFNLSGHKGRIYSLGFSADGRRLVSGGDGGAVRIWDSGHEAQ